MREAARGSALMEPVLEIGGWRVVMLDTGCRFGIRHAARRPARLGERALSEAPDHHHLVCLHHHPVSIGSRWMDRIGLRNPRRCSRCWTATTTCVRCSGATSIRRSISRAKGFGCWPRRRRACSSRRGRRLRVDSAAPGYRWLRLYADGRLETDVSRVSGIDFEIDYSVKGY